MERIKTLYNRQTVDVNLKHLVSQRFEQTIK